jgi:hypothetical protein
VEGRRSLGVGWRDNPKFMDAPETAGVQPGEEVGPDEASPPESLKFDLTSHCGSNDAGILFYDSS